MDTCTDSRGIRRGRCTDSICPCPSYDGGAEKKRCIKCGHPPGKHQHLDNPSANMGTPSGIMSNSSHTGYHIAAPPQPPPDLPLCAADECTNKVWYEFDLREAFDYCSPECRDRHLLPIKKIELEEELAVMRQVLESEARKDSPKIMQRQLSNGRSAQSQQQLPGQRQSSPPKSSPSSSPSTPSTSAKAAGSKPGKTKEIMIEKKARKPSGLILSKKPYVTDKAEVVGFIIVGVVKDAPVYSKFQDDQIRLLDVIETVNDTPCDKIFLPNMDLQERFEHSIEEREHVTLKLNRRIALPPVSSALAFAKKKSVKYTHVTVLMWCAENKDDTYGLSLNQECKAKGSVTDSPADLSRTKFDYKVTAYVVASQEEMCEGQLVTDKQLSLMKRDLQTAHQAKNSIILFVKRPETITYI